MLKSTSTATNSFLSAIYGLFLCKAKNLRSENSGGKLNVLPHPMNPDVFKPLLPRIATNHECLSPTGLCHNAGDDRNNEQFSLTTMHTIWVRHHNFIAEKLSIINPHWNDEKLYQEARKIVIAQIPHITYKEKTIVFAADLLPTAGHLPLPYVMGFDTRPLLTLSEKEKFLNEAADQNYYLWLQHDAHNPVITVKHTEKGVRLNEKFNIADIL